MTDFITWLCAILPILVLFVAMSVFHMKTESAALIGLSAALLAAIVVGGASVRLLGLELIKGAWSAVSILIVIWPALVLYEILQKGSVFQAIRCLAVKNSRDQLLLVLIFSWLFSSFLQGITGFGVPVAVCAPLLIAIGMKPFWAVVVTLMGHAWANTYGTFALAWDALQSQAGIPLEAETAILTGAFLWAINFLSGCLISYLYGGKRALKHVFPFVVLISVIQGGGQLLVSLFNATIAAFLPTTLALAATVLTLRLGYFTEKWGLPSKLMTSTDGLTKTEEGAAFVKGVSNLAALLPFLLLVAFSLLILVVKPINQFLSGPVVALSFPETMTGRGFVNPAIQVYGPLHVFTHAGFVLLLVVSVTYTAYCKKKLVHVSDFPQIWKNTLRKTVPASLGILLLVMMSQVLKGSGMMEEIARGVTNVAGNFYGFAAPFIGILGAFVTSSNTSSNILLGSFQHTAAKLLEISPALILTAQTVGGAVGTVVGPSTILLGTTTAGCRGEEGNVLKMMLPIAGAEICAVGLITLLLTVVM